MKRRTGFQANKQRKKRDLFLLLLLGASVGTIVGLVLGDPRFGLLVGIILGGLFGISLILRKKK